MCDYSLNGILTRPAVVAETLASTNLLEAQKAAGFVLLKWLPKERAVPKWVLEL